MLYDLNLMRKAKNIFFLTTKIVQNIADNTRASALKLDYQLVIFHVLRIHKTMDVLHVRIITFQSFFTSTNFSLVEENTSFRQYSTVTCLKKYNLG